ncbi:class I SAM-dependent methyltransferase [Leifsonia poae]|uniref:class I SAM-dependent methyltransferase n=1 Tax=Leifsonia poae TaxID=110933 RepID=UPI003D67B906
MSVLSRLVPIASQRFPKLSSRVLASSGYTLDVDSFGDGAFSVWSDATARRQDRAWQPIIADALAGNPREDVVSLHAAVDALPARPSSLLESGCGGGYNSAVLTAWLPEADYLGIDISASMIALATEHYPAQNFEVASAYDLPAADSSRDVVIDGVALIHMPDWQRAVSEYARVTRGHVILHGVTVTELPTTRFAKYAYGQPAQEFVFNRAELLGVAEKNGLRLMSTHPGLDYDLADYLGIPSVSEAWVLSLA